MTEAVSVGAYAYGSALRGAVRGLWSGVIDAGLFYSMMLTNIDAYYEMAWREGAAMCGIGPADRTTEEQNALNREIMLARSSVAGFGLAIEQGARALGGKLRALMPRVAIWQNRYPAIVMLAQVMSCSNQKMRWEYGGTHEHCADCATYVGKVYRASVWHRWGAVPQSHALDCGGWRCQCRLVPTDEPVTPGRPHSPKGAGAF